MRRDEIFALESIADRYSGEWKPGENPPDGYITIGKRVIAVEVSTLTQHVTDDRGTRPRRSDDAPAIRLANELNAELGNAIASDKRIILILHSPIVDFRKTKAQLAVELSSIVSCDADSGRLARKLSVCGNDLEVLFGPSEGNDGKKIVGFVINRPSRADIAGNAVYMLEDRIKTKAGKFIGGRVAGPIWLALRNDYFLAEANTYRHALKSVSVSHPFEKILLVSDNSSVDVLFDASNEGFL